MAQWTGQFTGRTHETKVQDIEVSLRRAVEGLKASPQADRQAKLKAVRRLAERLRVARLKALRARLSVLTEPGRKRLSEAQASHLRTLEAEFEAQDVDAVLREFGLHDEPVV